MSRYLSGRKLKRNRTQDDPYRYIGLEDAEPDLGNPLSGPPVPAGSQYQLVAVPGFPGKRYWVPVGGGLIPGAISVYD